MRSTRWSQLTPMASLVLCCSPIDCVYFHKRQGSGYNNSILGLTLGTYSNIRLRFWAHSILHLRFLYILATYSNITYGITSRIVHYPRSVYSMRSRFIMHMLVHNFSYSYESACLRWVHLPSVDLLTWYCCYFIFNITLLYFFSLSFRVFYSFIFLSMFPFHFQFHVEVHTVISWHIGPVNIDLVTDIAKRVVESKVVLVLLLSYRIEVIAWF